MLSHSINTESTHSHSEWLLTLLNYYNTLDYCNRCIYEHFNVVLSFYSFVINAIYSSSYVINKWSNTSNGKSTLFLWNIAKMEIQSHINCKLFTYVKTVFMYGICGNVLIVIFHHWLPLILGFSVPCFTSRCPKRFLSSRSPKIRAKSPTKQTSHKLPIPAVRTDTWE